MAEQQPLPAVDRRAASHAAVAARRARSELKQRLACGEVSPLTALYDATEQPGGVAGRLRVTDFLTALPSIGRVKMERILTEVGIDPSRRLGGLGSTQRATLREFLVRWLAARGQSNRLVVLAGPTAVGKGTVAEQIRRTHPEVIVSVSATTRSPRPGEVDGESYHFVTGAEFDRMIAHDQMLEWAVVHNANRYGTPRKTVEEALATGRGVLLEIDIQGARAVRQSLPDAILVFLQPPSWDELVRRLVGRGTETAEEQQRRLATARVELAAAAEFDHQVVNNTVAEAAEKVVELMKPRPKLR